MIAWPSGQLLYSVQFTTITAVGELSPATGGSRKPGGVRYWIAAIDFDPRSEVNRSC